MGLRMPPGSPRIAVWQLWNEPNHWETWLGSAEEYGNLLVAGYAAAKEADPTAIVATAGLFVFDGSYDDGVGHKDGLYFFDQVLQAVPEAWDSFDALAIHPYMPDKAPDSTDILSKVTYWGRIKTTNDWMTARTTQYGGDKRPIWISEVGWMTCIEEDTQAALSSGEPGRWERYRIPEEYVKSGASTATNGICKTEAEQANYMVRSHIIAHTLGIQHLNYLQLEDKFDTHLRDIWQATAIINTKAQNYEPKVAYGAYQTLTSLLTNMHYIGLGSQHNYLYDPNLWPNPAARYHMRFQRNDGYAWVDVLWRSGGSQSVSLPLEQGIIEAEIITRNGARTPIDVSQGSVQVTIGESPVYIRQKLPIPTPTPTLTPTPSPTFTPSPTLTPSPTPTTTPTPVPTDTYEPDDTCDEAREIGVDGEEQRHTFHVDGDADWVRFQGIMGTTYLVEAVVPPDSPADVVLVAPEGCGGSSATRANPIVSDARFTRTTPLSEAVLVQAQHTLPNKSGPHLTYDLSVHTLPITNAGDVAIIVTEALSPTHPLRDTFRAVANQAYTLFRDMGYGWDQVYYLLPDLYDHPLTIDDVAQAFTEWAPQRVGEQGMITIYLIGQAKQMQSGETAVVVDNLATQYLSPTLLSQWMTYLPVDVSTNVVIESPAGYAFIDSPLSQRGRIIISAADMTGDAWATENGLLFSDYFLAAMRRSSTFAQAFKETQWALSASHLSQSPQLDDNGSQTANDHSDGSFARRRGLRSAATPLSLEGPYAPATRALTITDKLLQAQVRREKNGALAEVYAVIVPSKGEASVTTALTETSYLTSTSPSYPMTRVREYALASGYDAIYEFGYTDVFSSPRHLPRRGVCR